MTDITIAPARAEGASHSITIGPAPNIAMPAPLPDGAAITVSGTRYVVLSSEQVFQETADSHALRYLVSKH